MHETAKYLLTEERIPKYWYNLVADLPSPPPPVLHPGTKQSVGLDDLAPLFPTSLIAQEFSTEREIEIPGPVRCLPPMASNAALPRAPLGESARYAGTHLLQI
jgi:tryptophan synthase beta chain